MRILPEAGLPSKQRYPRQRLAAAPVRTHAAPYSPPWVRAATRPIVFRVRTPVREAPTLALLLRGVYARGEFTDRTALDELQRRGWGSGRRLLALVGILLLVFPERLMWAANPVPDHRQASLGVVVKSCLFSMWVLSPLLLVGFGLRALALWMHNQPIPVLALALSIVLFAGLSALLWMPARQRSS